MAQVNPNRIIDSVTLRIVTYLSKNKDMNYTKHSLSEALDMSFDAIAFRWDELITLNILTEAPVQSPHDYYTYNEDSRASVILEELLYDIIEVEENK